MKKLFSISIFIVVALLAQVNVSAKKTKKAKIDKQVETVQGAGIVFDELTHDFGKVQETERTISTVFEFTNNGTEPLIVDMVWCSCMTPDWVKEPVAPGKKGFIKVTMMVKGRPGRFSKSTTVKSNATGEKGTIVLYIKGEVIPEQNVVPEN